jgi:hypothetical protein
MKKDIEMYLDEHAKRIIAAVVKAKKEGKFDTHDFILRLLQDLLDTSAGNDTIVQTIDGQIGRYLAKNQSVFGIKDTEKRRTSRNIKGTDSENEVWEQTAAS